MIKTGQVWKLRDTTTKFCVGRVKKDQIMEMYNMDTWLRPQDLKRFYSLDVLSTFRELIKRNK